VAGPPVEVQVRVNVEVVEFSSDVSWNWREVMLGTPGECERRRVKVVYGISYWQQVITNLYWLYKLQHKEY